MKSFIKKNLTLIISIFILLQPILDLATGISLHLFNNSFTIGIFIKLLFIIFLIYTSIFVYKKRVIMPYLILFVYGILYLVGTIIYKDSLILIDIHNLLKTYYFPVLLITLYSLKDEFRISNMTLFTSLFMYIIFIFLPTLFHVGYKSYEITKAGTLGFYNSANEISGIISLLTPIIFIIFLNDKGVIKKIILSLIYLVVILMIGTKTPLLTLIITSLSTLIYYWYKSIKKKKYKPILYSGLGLIAIALSLIIVIPKTNFYKNIQTHLDYLKIDNVVEVFKNEKLVDHFIFSQRLTFFKNKTTIYNKAPLYQKLFGIGYYNKNSNNKLIEMDYFDILYSHGIIGFLIFIQIFLSVIFSVFDHKQALNYERYMLILSFLFILFLSFFTGHIITSPSVSLIATIVIIKLYKRNKKDLLFSSFSMDIGGIEKALLNLVNRIDQNKYNITIILEEKKGIFLDKIHQNIIVKEVKVCNSSNILIRKAINFLTKYFYKILYFNSYDFSCCYATYSLSSSKIALLSSTNTAFYVHSDYNTIYKKTVDFKHFFDSRHIEDYKNIIFVSNENKKGFIKIYPHLKNRCHVFNNFINTKEIIEQSKEKITITKDDNKIYLIFVGRLDDESKKISRQINLVKNISNLNLWIIGDGPDKNKYIKEVLENKLEERIIFLGKKSNPFPYMKKADYVILTSDYEGFPVTYLEAITLNKEIITTFPTSDDNIDIKEYGNIISKDENKMIKEVKAIIKNKKINNKINLESLQKNRMNKLEKLFDGVI